MMVTQGRAGGQPVFTLSSDANRSLSRKHCDAQLHLMSGMKTMLMRQVVHHRENSFASDLCALAAIQR